MSIFSVVSQTIVAAVYLVGLVVFAKHMIQSSPLKTTPRRLWLLSVVVGAVFCLLWPVFVVFTIVRKTFR